MIPVINKPSKIIRKPATTIDDILINPFVHQTYKSDFLKCDISNQFPIFFPQKTCGKETSFSYIFKRIMNRN